MTEKEIQKLGFNKEVETGCESDSFYYYTYDVVDGINLITPAHDEIENGDWYVEFFDTTPPIRFKDFRDLQTVINILENSKVKG